MISNDTGTTRDPPRRSRTRTPPGQDAPRDFQLRGTSSRPPDAGLAVERHQAIWLDGRVPNGYWDRPAHRRLYLRWLGQRLGFRSRQDWYRITTDDFKRNAGGGLLHHWHDSAIYAVEESYRDYDWKEWLFNITPRHFWQDPKNHRQYMQWLGETLGIREPSDWYRVTNQDFRDHGGGAFLIHYDSTVSAAIKSYLPQYDWKEWMFDKTPKGFWQERKNRRRYITWLGEQLGFQTMEDWYRVTTDDFQAHYGNQLLKLYGGSPVAVLQDCFPRHAWQEWKFARVPVGFWGDLNNCKRYILWLGDKLQVRSPQDWHRVRRREWLENCGGGLLAMYRSPWEVLRKCVPGLERQSRKSDTEGRPERDAGRRRRLNSRWAATARSAANRDSRSAKGRTRQSPSADSRRGRLTAARE